MGRPKKEQAPDPLVRAREDRPQMPALRPPPSHNGPEPAAETLARALIRLQRLDQQISALNGAKSDIYREMRDEGFDPPTIKRVLKDKKVDPLLREERAQMYRTYWQALEGALDAAEAEEAAS